jgi:putative tricarboxylic transport membrane protein
MNAESKTGLSHRTGDALTGLALAAGGAVFAVLAWPIPRGEIGNPGPGFLPLVLGLALVVLGLGCAMRAWRTRDAATVMLAETKAVVCVVALFGAALLFVPLGFVPTIAIFLAVLFGVLAGMRWWAAAIAGCGASVALWLVFDYLLGLGLPTGMMTIY